jgi:hypothetical protein
VPREYVALRLAGPSTSQATSLQAILSSFARNGPPIATQSAHETSHTSLSRQLSAEATAAASRAATTPLIDPYASPQALCALLMHSLHPDAAIFSASPSLAAANGLWPPAALDPAILHLLSHLTQAQPAPPAQPAHSGGRPPHWPR